MSNTRIQDLFAPIKRWTPRFVWQPLRAVLTAVMTPLLFSITSGHFRSSIRRKPVSSKGLPIPWYTYPCIDFLATRDFTNRRVLEAGAGNSTLWWAKRSSFVMSLEGNIHWIKALAPNIPANASIEHVSMRSASDCIADVMRATAQQDLFDVIVIDGLHRVAILPYLSSRLRLDGALICDNAEGFGFFEELRTLGFERVDFFGFAPGVINRHCTSIAFRGPGCFLFSPDIPIQRGVDVQY
jgi:hypothetical protein